VTNRVDCARNEKYGLGMRDAVRAAVAAAAVLAGLSFLGGCAGSVIGSADARDEASSSFEIAGSAEPTPPAARPEPLPRSPKPRPAPRRHDVQPTQPSMPLVSGADAPAVSIEPGALSARRPPASADPSVLIGLTEAEAAKLIGPPARSRELPPARVWSYDAHGCAFQLFFYYDLGRQAYRSLLYATEREDVPSSDLGRGLGSLIAATKDRA